jgi:hypothetical protein
MISIIDLFFFLSTLFIWVEIFGFLSRDSVYKRLDLNVEFNYKRYLTFYLLRVLYLIWIPIGFFTSLNYLFSILFLLGFIRVFLPLTKNNILINLYDFLNTVISTIVLLIILYQVIFQ